MKQRGGKASRQKGDRIEREIVARHKDINVHAERYPLSGASKFRGSGHDTDVYAFGRDQAPLVAEVKGRKGGKGFTTLEKWLGEYDLLFLRRNNADPLVVLPWRVWESLLHAKGSPLPNPLVDPSLGLYSNGVRASDTRAMPGRVSSGQNGGVPGKSAEDSAT